ncbi:DUF1264 domain protein [Aspergillus heteromorphus CBS 117.55]|uniref:DUF1264 domain protein n=1 Tax=Aspergillus heteromorphus CBS 117.55 TaxID=1448321 RepID=A0A317UYR2_9EURO|nr:DUF1264 domain protein [Aspergillus heteromorphus CBS 117.55]PWY67204.1 DUF1264 domain protein [Aspergillus heteromorphus CBS 117.55]
MTSETTDNLPGDPLTTKSQVLETGAKAIQDFAPVKNICAHLNAFHVYASDKTRCVEANHYCSHITEDIRQCLLYDTPQPNARLLGIEYMITPRLFRTLPASERKLWHTHEYEVKSGMLIMPSPRGMPDVAWEVAETAEMRDIAPLYGKTYHFWQVDRGDVVPMGAPELMGRGLAGLVGERDRRFGVDWRGKREKRGGIDVEGERVEDHHDHD